MPQIFPKAMNPIARALILGLPVIAGSTGVGLAVFYRSQYATGAGEIRNQPVAFSHAHHSGQLGIDCRYCHTTVEYSHFANVPPTKTCMNCHQQIWQGADLLEPVRASYRENTAIPWERVHNVPHYAYFNHSIHVAKGVGCVSCHGRMDQQNLTVQTQTLLMEWCIACHREPEKHLRPRSEVTSMTWTPDGGGYAGKDAVWTRADLPHNGRLLDAHGNPVRDKDGALVDDDRLVGEFLHKDGRGKERPKTQAELGPLLKDLYRVRNAVVLTNCSMCHR